MSIFRTSNDKDSTWFVPAPRSPHPDEYDGPTERLYPDEPEFEPDEDDDPPKVREPAQREKRRGDGIVFAVVVALLALVASVGASVLAWRALDIAYARATPVAAPVAAPSSLKPSAPLAAAPTARPSATPAATPPQHPSVTPLDAASGRPTGGYTISYAQEPLRIQSRCSTVVLFEVLFDLNVPSADANDQNSDLNYAVRCGSAAPELSLGPGARAGSLVKDADTDAPGCAAAIRARPLAPGARVPVKKGTVLCLLTVATGGAQANVVLVEVTDVGVGGAAGMRATSWAVS